MHSARLFCRLFCARFFSWGSTREREGRGQAWQLAGAYSILNFCHFAMSIVPPPSPLLLAVGTKLAAFQQRCNICFVWLAAYPLHILPPNCSAPCTASPLPLLPRSALLLLAAKAPKSYSLCHRIASNNFASVSTSVASACHTPPPCLPAWLVVCFCRASERFAHLPVYMCCAVVYCSQWAWQGARETVIKRASAVACCHIKLPIYFLGLQQQRCNLATFCATDKFLCISYGSPHPFLPLPPATLKGAKSRCAF